MNAVAGDATSPKPGQPVVLGRRDLLVAAGLVLLVVGAGAGRSAIGVSGAYHDDAIYTSTARALAEGRGYRQIHLPGAPPQTKYPVLYPAALALLWWLWPRFPDNLLVLQGFTLITGAAAVGLAYLYLVRFRYCSRGVAAASGLLCATASHYLYFAGLTLSEAPFALLLVSTLWTMENAAAATATTRATQLRRGVMLALPSLCRAIGVTLIVAALWVLWRQRRPIRWIAAGAALALTPWAIWVAAARVAGATDPLLAYYGAENYFGRFGLGLDGMGAVLLRNGVQAMIGAAVLPLPVLFGTSWIVPAFVGLCGWVRALLNLPQRRLLPWFLLSYALLVWVWPWPVQRFLVPLMPLLTPYVLLVVVELTRPLPPRCKRPLLAVALAAALASNAVVLFGHAALTRRTHYPYSQRLAHAPEWRSYTQAFGWIVRNTAPDAVIACASALDPAVFLYSGRRAIRPFVIRPDRLYYDRPGPPIGTVEELEANLRSSHARYLLEAPAPLFAEEPHYRRLVAELRRRHPGEVVPVYRGADARFVIYALR